MRIAKITLAIMLISAVLVLGGCASTPEPSRRFFWPPAPDDPKIEWLGAYRTQHDLPKTEFQKFMISVFGEEEQINLQRPVGIIANSGKVYVVDSTMLRVVVYDFIKNSVHLLGKGKLEEVFRHPMTLAIDKNENIYISDGGNKTVVVVDKDEKIIGTLDLSKKVTRQVGIAIDNERGRLIVADTSGHKLEIFELNGNHLFTVGKFGDGEGDFNGPAFVAVMKNGNIVVSEARNARLQLFSPEGKFIRVIGNRGDRPGEFQLPRGVAVDSEGHIYCVDGKSNSFSIYSEGGDYLLTVGGAYSAGSQVAPGGFLLPQGMYIDKNDTIYVVDQLNSRFQVFQFMNDRYIKEHPVESTVPVK